MRAVRDRVMKVLMLFCLLGVCPFQAAAQNWDNSPNNFKNSPLNFNNSPNAWRNSPNNYDNSASIWSNSRNNWHNSPNNPKNYTVHDSSGNLIGYYARNANGVLVYFDNKGNRTVPSKASDMSAGTKKPNE